jgi:hypothetical protein
MMFYQSVKLLVRILVVWKIERSGGPNCQKKLGMKEWTEKEWERNTEKNRKKECLFSELSSIHFIFCLAMSCLQMKIPKYTKLCFYLQFLRSRRRWSFVLSAEHRLRWARVAQEVALLTSVWEVSVTHFGLTTSRTDWNFSSRHSSRCARVW